MNDLFNEQCSEFNQRMLECRTSQASIADDRNCVKKFLGIITMNTSMLAICENDLQSYYFFDKCIYGFEHLANHSFAVDDFKKLIHNDDQEAFEKIIIEGIGFAQNQRLEDLTECCFAFECRLLDSSGKYRRIQLVFILNENERTGGYNLLLLLSPVAHYDASKAYEAYHVVNIFTNEVVGKSKVNALTPKEVELLNLMYSSDSSKRIAVHLDKSEKTVCTQRKKLYQKLGICSCHQANNYVSKIAMIKGMVFY